MKRKVIVILSILLLTVGISITIYPAVSNGINELHSSYAIQNMNVQIKSAQEQQLEEQFGMAEDYNAVLRGVGNADDEASTKLLDGYNDILNFGNGIMGTIQIPKIEISLPIYHGVSDGILAKAVGHLPQSAFPVGGKGNHSVLTGHTGLPGAELFTDLTELETGDRFYIYIADRTLCYSVDQIKVVLPSETEDLAAVEGMDYCTLVTCTPYGVNSHRLLVRGYRVDEGLPDGEVLYWDTTTSSGEKGASVMVILAGLVAVILLLPRLLSGKRRG